MRPKLNSKMTTMRSVGLCYAKKIQHHMQVMRQTETASKP